MRLGLVPSADSFAAAYADVEHDQVPDEVTHLVKLAHSVPESGEVGAMCTHSSPRSLSM
jgi:hypothetical protein